MDEEGKVGVHTVTNHSIISFIHSSVHSFIQLMLAGASDPEKISSPVATGCHTGWHRYRTFPLS